MKPIAIDAAQMTHESFPTVAATAPMENKTSGGTPLATQNAPVQSMPRSRPALLTLGPAAPSAVTLKLGALREAPATHQKLPHHCSAISKQFPTAPEFATAKIPPSPS